MRAATIVDLLLRFAAIASLASALSACSSVEGFPVDPENSDATLKALQPYFQSDSEAIYNASTDPAARLRLRNDIVLHRLHAYDLEFDAFERSLNGSGNTFATSGDLLVLALNGLGATIQGTAAKSALAAASAGVVGAQGAINKDLYYQKTLPALLAQMEANRAKAKVAIFTGLALSDADYPLMRADLDIEALKISGGIPDAISQITQQAANSSQQSQTTVDALRTGTFSNSTTSQRIVAWLYPNGKDTDASGNATTPIPTNLTALTNWMRTTPTDALLQQVPWIALVRETDAQGEFEKDRAQAIADLKIP